MYEPFSLLVVIFIFSRNIPVWYYRNTDLQPDEHRLWIQHQYLSQWRLESDSRKLRLFQHRVLHLILHKSHSAERTNHL